MLSDLFFTVIEEDFKPIVGFRTSHALFHEGGIYWYKQLSCAI